MMTENEISKAIPPSLDRKFLCLLATVLVLTLVSGTLYGRLTQRWGASTDLVAAADHVRDFPRTLGAWKMSEDSTMSDKVQHMLECAGYVNRTYLHQKTGQSIGLAIIVGPPGPTAVHTPEICYSSRSYTIEDSPQKTVVDEPGHSFWGIRFKSRHAGTQPLQVYYAWNNGKQWEATDNPRIQFGGHKLLYKIQVSGNVDLGFGQGLPDPAKEFVNALSHASWSPNIAKSIANELPQD